MPLSPATTCWAELDGLFEVVNWSAVVKGTVLTFAVPIVLGVMWKIADSLARRKVRDRLDALEGQSELAKAKINMLEQTVGGQGMTIATQVEAVSQRDALLKSAERKLEQLTKELKKEQQKRSESEPFQTAYEPLKKQSQDDARKIAILEVREAEFTRVENRLRRARKLEGYLWRAKALQQRPVFRPMLERKTAIVSVLNLKGGVGKTTTVAQLGAAFARRGYRVLCVDLDLQGSLSRVLLEQQVINTCFDGERLLQHFFKASGSGANPRIAEFAQEVPSPEGRPGSLHVLPVTDELAFAEFNLTLDWLLKAGERDARFLLRKALHSKSVARTFDIVLLDCPPLLNISCMNALAASDYLLVPVVPGLPSLERVQNLLEVVRSTPFITHVNHNLNLLGMLANRTHSSGMTGDDRREWDQLMSRLQNLFGIVPRKFETTIPQLKAIQDGESITASAETNRRIEGIYNRLAGEIEKVLPHDCRRTAAVLPQLV